MGTKRPPKPELWNRLYLISWESKRQSESFRKKAPVKVRAQPIRLLFDRCEYAAIGGGFREVEIAETCRRQITGHLTYRITFAFGNVHEER